MFFIFQMSAFLYTFIFALCALQVSCQLPGDDIILSSTMEQPKGQILLDSKRPLVNKPLSAPAQQLLPEKSASLQYVVVDRDYFPIPIPYPLAIEIKLQDLPPANVPIIIPSKKSLHLPALLPINVPNVYPPTSSFEARVSSNPPGLARKLSEV